MVLASDINGHIPFFMAEYPRFLLSIQYSTAACNCFSFSLVLAACTIAFALVSDLYVRFGAIFAFFIYVPLNLKKSQ